MDKRKVTLLNQLRKMQERLETLHDKFNSKYGPAHEYTQKTMHLYALCYASCVDAESLFDEQNLADDE